MDNKTPHQLSEQGKILFQAGDFLSAAQIFEAAAVGFSQDGDELGHAEMENNRCVAYLQAGQAQDAFDAVNGTDLIFSSAGDVCKQGLALGNKAAALEALGMVDEALICYEQSADLLGSAGETELKGTALQALSALQLKSGHQYEAIASMQAGLASKKGLSLKDKVLKKLVSIPFRLLDR